MIDRWTQAIMTRIDYGLYVLFSRHAGRPRHGNDRERYRGAALAIGFETYLSRLYGLSWLAGVGSGLAVLAVGLAFAPVTTDILSEVGTAVAPGEGDGALLPGWLLLVATALVIGASGRRATIGIGGLYLRWRRNARRAAIERSLPGAVRYLRILADGSESETVLLRKVAEQDAYREASESFDRVLETAALTGSLDTGLRNVARETPSKELLAPFLLKFREHTNQGTDSVREYLRRESRTLSRRRTLTWNRTGGYLKLLSKVFVVLLVLPAIFVIVVTAGRVLTGELSRSVPIPGSPTAGTVLIYGSIAFVLAVGASAAFFVSRLRPEAFGRTYERPPGPGTLATVGSNPASAAFVFAFPAVLVGLGLLVIGESTADTALLAYVIYGLPVGAVAVNRARRDDTKDRDVRDFVHAVAHHVGLGQPLGVAVETVAGQETFGAIQEDIDDLAFRLGLTTGSADIDTRREALDRFVARVGTPLAEQTVGLVTGALAVGSDIETTFETLRTEIGSLYHQRKELRSTMLVYAAIGWSAALFVITIVVASETYLIGWVLQLSAAFEGTAASIDPTALDAERDGRHFYLVTQATMLACGWFSGIAARDRYAALLHSSVLVVICYIVFSGAGVV